MISCNYCNEKIEIEYYEKDPFHDDLGSYQRSNTQCWSFCKTCNVSYVHLDGSDKIIMTRFYLNFNNNSYCADLLHKENVTQIIKLPSKVEDALIVLMELPYLIKNISPQNIKEKVCTLIVFT